MVADLVETRRATAGARSRSGRPGSAPASPHGPTRGTARSASSARESLVTDVVVDDPRAVATCSLGILGERPRHRAHQSGSKRLSSSRYDDRRRPWRCRARDCGRRDEPRCRRCGTARMRGSFAASFSSRGPRVVGRSVVDDEQLPVLVALLRTDSIARSSDVAPIARRHDHRDEQRSGTSMCRSHAMTSAIFASRSTSSTRAIERAGARRADRSVACARRATPAKARPRSSATTRRPARRTRLAASTAPPLRPHRLVAQHRPDNDVDRRATGCPRPAAGTRSARAIAVDGRRRRRRATPRASARRR